jgi:hypothetical protein
MTTPPSLGPNPRASWPSLTQLLPQTCGPSPERAPPSLPAAGMVTQLPLNLGKGWRAEPADQHLLLPSSHHPVS